MSQTNVSISVDDVDQVVGFFKDESSKMRNMRPAFSKIGSLMLKSFDVNFSSYGSRFGVRWASRRKSYPWPLLHKTGAMQKSFKSSVGNDHATLFNKASYFQYHQKGTQNLPRRAMLGYTSGDINNIVQILRRHMNLGE